MATLYQLMNDSTEDFISTFGSLTQSPFPDDLISPVGSFAQSPFGEDETVGDSFKKRKATKNILWVLYLTMFMGTVNFTFAMGSLYPFMKVLNPDVQEQFLGWINAGYSFSNLIAAMAMGYICERVNPTLPIIMCIVLRILGCVLYIYADGFGTNGIWVLFAARIFHGLSQGNVASTRALASKLSSTKDRTKIMARLVLSAAFGFILGPAIQAISKPIGPEGFYVKSIRLLFNLYTAPCYLIILLSIVNAIAVKKYFVKELVTMNSANTSNPKIISKREAEDSETAIHGAFDFAVMLCCLVFWFMIIGVYVLNETVITPLIMNEYGYSHDKTTYYASLILTAGNLIAILGFLTAVPLAKKYGERNIIFAGFLIMAISFIFYFPFGPGYPKILASPIGNGTTNLSNGDKAGGCPYHWCRTTPSLAFGQLLCGVLLIGVGFRTSAVLLPGLYSKIIGPFPQSKYMGWLTAIGSLARVVGPLYVTNVYQRTGIRWTAVSVEAVLLLSLLLFWKFWRRLVPYEDKRHLIQLNHSIGS